MKLGNVAVGGCLSSGCDLGQFDLELVRAVVKVGDESPFRSASARKKKGPRVVRGPNAEGVMLTDRSSFAESHRATRCSCVAVAVCEED